MAKEGAGPDKNILAPSAILSTNLFWGRYIAPPLCFFFSSGGFQSFLGAVACGTTGGSQCSGFCTCCEKRNDGRQGYDTSLLTFLGSFLARVSSSRRHDENDSLLGFSFFYCVLMKLLGVVPGVTFMGGWSDVRDGIVHGPHFYQKLFI